MMAQVAFDQSIQWVDAGQCCKCGIPMAMPRETYDRRRRDHQVFYCLAGHAQHFTSTSDLELARAEAERARRDATQARWEAQVQTNRARAYKGQVTRIKRRVGNGVCPCCNRTFADLSRHMSLKHPEFAGEEPTT